MLWLCLSRRWACGIAIIPSQRAYFTWSLSFLLFLSDGFLWIWMDFYNQTTLQELRSKVLYMLASTTTLYCLLCSSSGARMICSTFFSPDTDSQPSGTLSLLPDLCTLLYNVWVDYLRDSRLHGPQVILPSVHVSQYVYIHINFLPISQFTLLPLEAEPFRHVNQPHIYHTHLRFVPDRLLCQTRSLA